MRKRMDAVAGIRRGMADGEAGREITLALLQGAGVLVPGLSIGQATASAGCGWVCDRPAMEKPRPLA